MSEPFYAWAWTGPALAELPEVLPALLRDPWISGYAVGFSPPLTRANRRLAEGLVGVTRALDKLPVYLRTCVLDPREQTRLAWRHRAIQTRLHGPLEAEAIATLYGTVLELGFTLFHPGRAPPELAALGEAETLLPEDAPPGERTVQILVRYDDPHHPRLLAALAATGRAVVGPDPYALELRAPPALTSVMEAWARERHAGRLLALGEPPAL